MVKENEPRLLAETAVLGVVGALQPNSLHGHFESVTAFF